MMFPKTVFFLAILTLMIFHQNNLAQSPPLETGVSQSLAKWRSANYSDVRYKLNLTVEKGAPLMKGDIEIRVKLTDEGAKNDLILDWRTTQFANDKDKPFANVVAVNEANATGANATGAQASSLAMSAEREQGVQYLNAADTDGRFRAHALIASGALALQSNEHLIIPHKFLKTGENVIKINFASPIKTSGAAITRYVDKEDGAEYVYSLFVPSDASTAFPVFDQPDLKARFQLNINSPTSWKVISNTPLTDAKKTIYKKWLGNTVSGQTVFEGNYSSEFSETKPISTYVFAFAAGEFAEYEDKIALEESFYYDPVIDPNIKELPKPYIVPKIYVRKSQAEKFKQHSTEVFRLNREGVEFLESYFDYKFPFPKYDLVLIPEFPFGGMEHAGATFLREASIIFPSEPTKNDYVSRANLIFHEAAHQWFGDTVTMKWFDDLWLKEGFAEFMAYKTLAKVMPEYNAWKIFYERNKQAAYLTDVTRGTTPIYQEIPNLSSAKSAYGNIVYRKAPSFLKQAEFYLGEKEFQTAVRAFLKKHEFSNATWQDLVGEFAEVKIAEAKKSEFYQKLSSGDQVRLTDFTKWSVEEEWAEFWVEKRGTAVYRITPEIFEDDNPNMQWTFAPHGAHTRMNELFSQQTNTKEENYNWLQDVKILKVFKDGLRKEERREIGYRKYAALPDAERNSIEERKKKNQELGRQPEKVESLEQSEETEASRKFIEDYHRKKQQESKILYVFPNYQDYGYGIFLLDEKSRAYVLANIQNETDDFLRTMMWGSLWDSVRFYELAPEDYVKLVIKNINVESDESTIQSLLSRVSTAMNYYIASSGQSVPPASAGGSTRQIKNSNTVKSNLEPSANADGTDKNALASELEKLLINKIETASSVGQKITYFRALQSIGSSEQTKQIFKDLLSGKSKLKDVELKTKDKFDLVTRLIILGDKDALNLLANLEKTETDDAAKRYAYAAKAGIPTAENKLKYWKDFTENKEISENWIESAFGVWNTPRHADLTFPYLEKALTELPNLKKNRKIFFVNGWLSSFIGGQKSETALNIVNKFLADNPDLDKDLRLKILENSDNLERAVKIRAKYGMN